MPLVWETELPSVIKFEFLNYAPFGAVNGPYVLHTPSLLLRVRMLSTYGACISLLHEGTMRYGSFDPYGP